MQYIAFLRGINVSGKNKLKMDDLRSALAKAGFTEVQTYIQSGNIIIADNHRTPDQLAAAITATVKLEFGYDVPTIVLTATALTEIIQQHPALVQGDFDVKKTYFTLLENVPQPDALARLQAVEAPTETWSIHDKTLFLYCENGMGKAKINNSLIESKLGVTATTRNLKTMRNLVELSTSN